MHRSEYNLFGADSKYVDVVVQRWQDLSGTKATLDGDGRTFEEIANERVPQPT